MKKIISQWKWDKLFEECEKSLGQKDTKGNLILSPEEESEWLKRIDEINDKYIVIGPRVLINNIKNKIYNYKLKHLSLGKVHYLTNSKDDREFEIVKIPWNLHWQTDMYLLVIIRDYLRNFINSTKAIGNCVFTKEELDPKYKEYYKAPNKDRGEEWKKLVNDVADEFDELYKMQLHKYDIWDEEKYRQIKAKAFKDLEYIFDDLNW